MAAARLSQTDPKSLSPNYKWWVVVMLWFICFFNYADRQAISVVLPALEKEFGFDTLQQGYIASAFMWIYAAGAPMAGYIGDRFRRKDLILGGCIFWSFVTMLTGWCSKLWHFVTVRALEGFGETFYFPASMSLVSDYHSRETRSRAMSVHQSSVYIGTIGGSWFAAWLAQEYNWRWGFYIFGGAGMILALALYFFLREPQRERAVQAAPAAPDPANPHPTGGPNLGKLFFIPPALLAVVILWTKVGGLIAWGIGADEAATQSWNEWWGLYGRFFMIPALILLLWALWTTLGELKLRNPTALLLMAGFLGANAVATIFLIWTPTFLIQKFNYGLSAAGLTGSVFIQIGSALSVPLGGYLADRYSRRLAGGRMLVQAGGLLLGAGFVVMVGLTKSVTTLLVAMSLFGVCKGIYDSNIFASLYDVIPPESRASAAGVMNFIGWGGGAVGPIFFGWMAEKGTYGSKVENMSHAISFGGGVYLAAAALIIIAALAFAKRDVARARQEAA